MLENIIGQPRACKTLNKLFEGEFQGRTIIFKGVKGIGKFYTAIQLAKQSLNENPFLSANFQFYRNDDFSLKTRFYLDALPHLDTPEIVENYYFYLLGKIAQTISLGQVAGKMGDFISLRDKMEELLLNRRFINELKGNKKLNKSLLEVSDELNKKNKIPISFVRQMIDFHSQKATGKYKISVIADFEQATEEAQNAALKLFEEPPASSVLILTSEDTKYILPTILSRSIIVQFDRLNAADIKEIFGANPFHFKNTVDFMEDEIYQYAKKKKEQILYFFKHIAPGVQYGNDIFLFIDDLAEAEENLLTIRFLEEMSEFFRNLHLYRQQYLRNLDLNKFIDEDYYWLTEKIVKNTNTAEISELNEMVSTAVSKIKYSNGNSKTILPAVLIDISRWYQRKNR